MGTESDQSSGNRNIGAWPEDSREEERQRTGLFRWDNSENLMPSWSVPPGLMVPGPRQPEPDVQPSRPEAGPEVQPAAEEPASGDNAWPGVAPPAGWFLHAAQSPPDARQGSASAQEPKGDRPEGSLNNSPYAGAVPSPTRKPDGSWSSPLTPKPARRRLGPTQARYGRAGGPGFQLTRARQPGPEGASTGSPRLSPWQRSHRLWAEAGHRVGAAPLPAAAAGTTPAADARARAGRTAMAELP